MHWLLLAGLVLVLVIMSIRFPRVGLPILGVFVVVGSLLFFYTQGEVEKASALIATDRIQLDHMKFEGGYAGSYNVSGRIRNQSAAHTLTEVTIQLVMSDCAPQTDECEILGDVSTRIATHVPPGQARDFKGNVYFEKAQPRGEVAWDYQVIASQAR